MNSVFLGIPVLVFTEVPEFTLLPAVVADCLVGVSTNLTGASAWFGMAGIHFARFSLGQGVPSFGPIEVRRHSDSQVLIEVEIRYASAVDVLLKAEPQTRPEVINK